MNKAGIYLKSILIPVIVGGVSGFIISGFIDYDSLQKPFLAPPSFLFPIVWTILYILMGISYGRLKSKEQVDRQINAIYYIQLVMNALWSIFFFVAKWRFFSFFWLILLILAVSIMIIKFYRKDEIAGLLQIPYLLWCLYAAYLNLSTYILNR